MAQQEFGFERSDDNYKTFVCRRCSKGFPSRSALRIHFRIHSGERPFVCTECNKAFTQQGHLKTHYQTHTKEKPFQCKICGKNFCRRSYLRVHLQIHVNKPFTCKMCSVSFSTQEEFNLHCTYHKRSNWKSTEEKLLLIHFSQPICKHIWKWIFWRIDGEKPFMCSYVHYSGTVQFALCVVKTRKSGNQRRNNLLSLLETRNRIRIKQRCLQCFMYTICQLD